MSRRNRAGQMAQQVTGFAAQAWRPGFRFLAHCLKARFGGIVLQPMGGRGMKILGVCWPAILAKGGVLKNMVEK